MKISRWRNKLYSKAKTSKKDYRTIFYRKKGEDLEADGAMRRTPTPSSVCIMTVRVVNLCPDGDTDRRRRLSKEMDQVRSISIFVLTVGASLPFLSLLLREHPRERKIIGFLMLLVYVYHDENVE